MPSIQGRAEMSSFAIMIVVAICCWCQRLHCRRPCRSSPCRYLACVVVVFGGVVVVNVVDRCRRHRRRRRRRRRIVCVVVAVAVVVDVSFLCCRSRCC